MKLGEGREQVNQSIRGVYADGGTALYDAVDRAYVQHMQRRQEDRGKIAAIVVLSDGEDRDSRLDLEQLLQRIRFDNETRTVRVFTIAYGDDAKEDVLQRIADATQARHYKGTPENIRSVLREIATFF